MRVCHFISYSADAHYLKNLGIGLAGKDVSVIYGTLFATGKKTPEWIRQTPKADYFCLNAKSKLDFPIAVIKLAMMLRREKVDILQTHLYEASFVGLLAAQIARTKLRILTRHHLDQAHLIGNRLSLTADRWETKKADNIVVLSNAVREFLISREGVPGDKINTIYQGFDFKNISATDEDGRRIRAEFNLAETDFVIATIGNFFPTKGHRFLLAAAKELIKEIPSLKILFVGGGGGEEAVRNEVRNSGLIDKVAFVGFRNDVSSFMKAADVVVHPSLSEAFCQVLIETMSVGTALISTDVGGAKEVITDGETGLLIPAESAAAIIAAVEKIFRNREFAHQMALAGQMSVRERFTVEKMVDRQFECYQTWLKDKSLGER